MRIPRSKKVTNKLILVALFLLFKLVSYGQTITGTVFKDFNADGTQTSSTTYVEPGMASVVVKATKPDGSLLMVTYAGSGTATSSTGSYTVTGGTLGQIRLEFILPDSYTFASKGATGGTTVMFPAGATQNLAVNSPEDYWDTNGQPNPQLIVPCYVNGAITNPGATSHTGIAQLGNNQNGASGSITINEVAKASETGTVWGEAFQKSKKRMFFSAFLKRQAGLGPKGVGGIYIAEPNASGIYKIVGSFTLQGVTPSNTGTTIDLGSVTRVTSPSSADNYLAVSTMTEPSRDLDAFGKIGAISYGDIDIDEANQTLFLTNLNQNSLIKMDISRTTASLSIAPTAMLSPLITTYNIASLPGVPTCTGGNLRVWGLKIYKGRGYLGAVCDAATSQNQANLKGYVLSFDPENVAAGFTTEITLDMSYRNSGGDYTWHPWATSWSQTSGDPSYYIYTQPIVSDIEFNENGDMTIALSDRLGHQMGAANYEPKSGSTKLISVSTPGDILQARKNASGKWVMEGTAGTIAPNFTAAINKGTGYGNVSGTQGEYYNDLSGDDSPETVMGSLAKIMGTGRIVSTTIDPYPPTGTPGSAYYDSGGIHWFNSTTGAWTQWAQLYAQDYGVDFGKAVGLGDIEANLTPPPIEIGNRVWNDTDNDGIQDAGETGIAGVSVSLCTGAGAPIATAITDNNGNYFFSSATGTSSTSAVYSLTALAPNTGYQLKFPTTTVGKSLVTANAGADNIDSDPSASGIVSFTTGSAGQNDHTFDAGYSTATCSLTATASSGTCNSSTNQYTVSGTISLTSNTASGTATITDGAISTTVTVAANATSVAYSLTGLTSDGASHTVTVSLPSCGTTTATYGAPASCTAPAPSLVVVSATICSGTSATLVASGCTGTVTWSNSTTGTTLITPTLTQTTSYTATCTVGGSTTTAVGTVTVMPPPVLSLQASRTLVTVGTPVSLSAVGCLGTIAWSTGDIGTSISVTPANPTNVYWVTCTTGPTCSTTASITVTTAPAPSLVVVSSTICSGTSATLVASGCTGSVTWSNNTTGTTLITPTLTQTTSYTATCTVGGATTTAVGTVTVMPAPVLSLQASSTLVTVGTPVSLSAIGCVGSIVWSTGDTGTTISVTPSNSTNVYSATCTTGPTCSTTASVTVTTQTPACLLALRVTPGSCTSATNQYILTGTVSLTNAKAGSLIITDGSVSTVLTVTTNQLTAIFSLTGIRSDGLVHTVIANLSSCGQSSTTYTAPQSCTATCQPPVHVCKGSNYAIDLSTTTGLGTYQWYRDGMAIIGATQNSYMATQAGSYSVVVNGNVVGQCPDGSCCPIVIVEDSIALYQANAQSPTCSSATSVNADGRILVSNWKLSASDTASYFYQVSLGSSFDAAHIVAGGSNQPVPVNGVLVANLPNPLTVSGQAYTVRISNGLGCSKDVVVNLPQTVCACPPVKCVPLMIRRTR